MKTFYFNYVTNGKEDFPLLSKLEEWSKGKIEIAKSVSISGIHVETVKASDFKPIIKEVVLPFKVGDFIKRKGSRSGFYIATITQKPSGYIWLGSEWEKETGFANGLSYWYGSDEIVHATPTEIDKIINNNHKTATNGK